MELICGVDAPEREAGELMKGMMPGVEGVGEEVDTADPGTLMLAPIIIIPAVVCCMPECGTIGFKEAARPGCNAIAAEDSGGSIEDP